MKLNLQHLWQVSNLSLRPTCAGRLLAATDTACDFWMEVSSSFYWFHCCLLSFIFTVIVSVFFMFLFYFSRLTGKCFGSGAVPTSFICLLELMDVAVNACVSIFNRGDSCLSVSRWKASRPRGVKTHKRQQISEVQKHRTTTSIQISIVCTCVCTCVCICVCVCALSPCWQQSVRGWRQPDWH